MRNEYPRRGTSLPMPCRKDALSGCANGKGMALAVPQRCINFSAALAAEVISHCSSVFLCALS